MRYSVEILKFAKDNNIDPIKEADKLEEAWENRNGTTETREYSKRSYVLLVKDSKGTISVSEGHETRKHAQVAAFDYPNDSKFCAIPSEDFEFMTMNAFLESGPGKRAKKVQG